MAKASRAAPTKRSRLSDLIALEIADGSISEDDFTGMAGNMVNTMLLQLEIMCNTWVFTGCFDVSFEGTTTKYCHWQDACKYTGELRERCESLLDRYTDDSVNDYLVTVEEQFRAWRSG